MTDRKAFEEGMILGLVSPPLPHVAKKEPIAYSYNGVVLPGLPEWDREMYPYAVIMRNFSTSLYFLWLLSSTEVTESNGVWGLTHPAGNPYTQVNTSDDTPVWAELATSDSDRRITLLGLHPLIWANFDVLDGDGSVYLAKSDPIPEYE